MDRTERSLIARIAADTRWARATADDRKMALASANAARMSQFERDVDPEGQLDPAERARRAKNAQRAHMSRMALKSAQVRRRVGGR